MLTITKRYTFEAAHYLPDYDGPCQRLHGHSYKLEVTVTGVQHHTGSKRGMVLDFSDLDVIVKPLVEVYDHQVINNVAEIYPTAENLVMRFVADITRDLKRDLTLTRVRLYETERCYAEYTA